MRTLLIDGDIFIYQIASKAEQPVDWGNGQWTLSADLESATQELDDYFKKLQETLDADKLVVAIKDKENWRRSVLPSYKANRQGVREPILRQPLMLYVQDKYQTFARPTLEGDDVLGILSTSTKIIPGEKIIVSIDKDMKQIPGLCYNPNRPDEGVVETDAMAADMWHMHQTLTGDSTDGYRGCPGVGPKSADKILWNAVDNGEPGVLADIWAGVVTAYENKGLTEADALTQARVARICRASDYDFKERKVVLWQPPV